MVAELNETNYPIWKCYYNMLGVVATSLVVELLTQGTIINKAVVFGVVALVNHPKHSQLIKLECNFETEKWEFSRCCGLFDIDILSYVPCNIDECCCMCSDYHLYINMHTHMHT